MGRKIPGKKHRGVKDPEKQRAKRLQELETKINAPPKNIDDQDIPKSLERVIKLKNAVKNNGMIQKKKKKKRKERLIKVGLEQNVKVHPKRKPEKVVPIFSQRPGETQHQFWNRVNRETHNFIKETEFETKFNVQVKRNVETGQIEGLEKKPKCELDELERLKLKHKNIKRKKKVDSENNVVLTKSQKRKQKLLQKKQKKDEEEVDEFKTFKDKVEFGDVVHAPPEIKVHPKNAGRVQNKVKCKSLLLNSILEASEPLKNEKTIDRTGKRKDLPVGERRQLEKQQKDVIAAYRLLKARKLGDTTVSA